MKKYVVEVYDAELNDWIKLTVPCSVESVKDFFRSNLVSKKQQYRIVTAITK